MGVSLKQNIFKEFMKKSSLQESQSLNPYSFEVAVYDFTVFLHTIQRHGTTFTLHLLQFADENCTYPKCY